MRHVSSLVVSLTAIITMALPGIASAAGQFPGSGGQYHIPNANPANGEKIFNEGKGSAPPCTSCHGADGTGNEAIGAPRLAGQYFSFLLKQLNDFANFEKVKGDAGGFVFKGRKDLTLGQMNGIASALSEQDRRDVAAFLAEKRVKFAGTNLKQLKEQGKQVGDIAKGKSLVKWGQGERGIPACKSCHGYNGRGAPPLFPLIGQQRYSYLVNQLKYWRKGAESGNPEEGRINDPMAAMREVAKNLTDEDIHNAAAYLTRAPLFGPGDIRTPYANLVKSQRRFEFATTE